MTAPLWLIETQASDPRRCLVAQSRWIRKVENQNLTSIRAGLLKCRMPDEYGTNDEQVGGWVEHWLTRAEDEHVERANTHLKQCLEWIGGQLHQRGDQKGAARIALLHRHLFGGYDPASFIPAYTALNTLFFPCRSGGSVFSGVDHLAAIVDDALQNPTGKQT